MAKQYPHMSIDELLQARDEAEQQLMLEADYRRGFDRNRRAHVVLSNGASYINPGLRTKPSEREMMWDAVIKEIDEELEPRLDRSREWTKTERPYNRR